MLKIPCNWSLNKIFLSDIPDIETIKRIKGLLIEIKQSFSPRGGRKYRVLQRENWVKPLKSIGLTWLILLQSHFLK